jgi:MFS transporter, AAHS family, 4-hydroxybenzoate transporter
MAEPSIDAAIGTAIDGARLRGVQVTVFVLCALVALLDGFDTQSVSFVVPLLAEEWGVAGTSFGPVFSAGLLGVMLGQIVFGQVSDRIGRRAVIVMSAALFGTFTLLSAASQGWWQLLALRFLAGIGLGGAVPNVIALTSEFAPRRLRALLIGLVFGGFPLGAVLGGLLTIEIIPVSGWRGVFVLGGVVPLLLCPLLLWLLPESPRFLATRADGGAALARVMARIAPERRDARWRPDEARAPSLPLGALFGAGRAAMTATLWGSFFLSLLVIYFLMSWLPLVVKQRGFPIDVAIHAAVFFNLGGAVGGVVLGRLLDRLPPFAVLGAAYAAGAAAIVAVGAPHDSATLLLASACAAGFCVVGAQTGLCAVAAGLYPTAMRSTGIGAGLAFGRIGSVVGPTAGGLILAAGWPLQLVFFAIAVPALAAASSVWLLRRLHF